MRQPIRLQRPTPPLRSVDDAIRFLRSDPNSSDLVRDAYLGRDVRDSAARFLASGEFAALRELLGDRVVGADVLDVGAGTGMASAAMLASGVRRAIALEPDASDEVGRGAIQRLGPLPGLEIMDGWGEHIELPDSSIDIVYCRQALHHAQDLDLMLVECARVLRPGGVLVACREHVVDNATQLRDFRAAHPMHRLVGGENAFSLSAYLTAIRGSGLSIKRVLGPWDSVINAYPLARTDKEMVGLPLALLRQRLGRIGPSVTALPGAASLANAWLNRPRAGRLYTFLAEKPVESITDLPEAGHG